jgi:hypothetical protein
VTKNTWSSSGMTELPGRLERGLDDERFLLLQVARAH